VWNVYSTRQDTGRDLIGIAEEYRKDVGCWNMTEYIVCNYTVLARPEHGNNRNKVVPGGTREFSDYMFC